MADQAKTDADTDVRAKAKKFLQILVNAKAVYSKGGNEALFTPLTGMSHSGLQTTWEHEDKAKAERRAKGQSTKGLATTTSCNGLTGKLGQAINAPIGLGRFDLKEELTRQGLLDAWVQSGPDVRPGYGDVVRFVRFHVGVSLDFVGDTWNTAECGQGGPGADYKNATDSCKYKSQPWNHKDVFGWVDIAVLDRIGKPAPAAMQGWWEVTANGKTEWIWIPERGKVLVHIKKPPSFKFRPVVGNKTGTMRVSDDKTSISLFFGKQTYDFTLKSPVGPMEGKLDGVHAATADKRN